MYKVTVSNNGIPSVRLIKADSFREAITIASNYGDVIAIGRNL